MTYHGLTPGPADVRERVLAFARQLRKRVQAVLATLPTGGEGSPEPLTSVLQRAIGQPRGPSPKPTENDPPVATV